MATKLENICTGLEMLAEDSSVPRNIRKMSDSLKTLLLKGEGSMDVRKAHAISSLDDLANDPNIPMHGRTLVWQIMSKLETL